MSLDARLRRLERAARTHTSKPACQTCGGHRPLSVVYEREDDDHEVPARPDPCPACGRPPRVIVVTYVKDWRTVRDGT